MKVLKAFGIATKAALEVATDLFETAEQGSKLLLNEATKARVETMLDADLEWSDEAAVTKAFENVLKLDKSLSDFRASSRARG